MGEIAREDYQICVRRVELPVSPTVAGKSTDDAGHHSLRSCLSVKSVLDADGSSGLGFRRAGAACQAHSLTRLQKTTLFNGSQSPQASGKMSITDNTESRLEKGEEKLDVHEQLAAEVYGVGDVDKFSSCGLRLRAFVRRFGAEENGIERIVPSARIEQKPIGTSDLSNISNPKTYSISLPVAIVVLRHLHWVLLDQVLSSSDGNQSFSFRMMS